MFRSISIRRTSMSPKHNFIYKEFTLWLTQKHSTLGKFKREGTYVYLRLIHVDRWQKPTQDCEAIIFQLKINFKKALYSFLNMLHLPVLIGKTEMVKTRRNKYRRGGWETTVTSSCLHTGSRSWD